MSNVQEAAARLWTELDRMTSFVARRMEGDRQKRKVVEAACDTLDETAWVKTPARERVVDPLGRVEHGS